MLLGAPFNEAIDVWSLGCIAAEIMMNSVLFEGFDEYDMIRHIYHTVGKAPEHMLSSGMYTKDYHTYAYIAKGEPVWIFPSSHVARNYNIYPHALNELSELLKYKVSHALSGEDLRADECDRVAFVDLLTKTLKVDGAERLTPSEILQHPFITMSHLVGTFKHSSHVKKGMELMTVCKNVNCDDKENSNFAAGSAHHGGPEEGHPAELDHLITGENSSNKRKWDGEEDTEHGKRSPNTTPEKKKQRTESEKGAPIETAEKACSSKSLLQIKRDDADDAAHHGGPEESHPAELDHLITGQNSPNKRKRDGEDNTEHGKRSPNPTPENKKQRTESEKGAQIETGEKACSSKSLLQERKRDDADDAAHHGGPEESHSAELDHLITGQNSSNKRKRDGEDDTEHGKRSPISTPENKKQRTESEKGAQIETGEKTCSSKSMLLKRKRDDADEGTAFKYSSSSKKRGDVSLSQDLIDNANRLFSSTGATGPYFTRVSQPQNRERDEEEAADSMSVKSTKMRRGAKEEGAKSADG